MPATFYIEQFGCRATQADAAAIERQLRERGCAPVSEATSAEIVIVNTCTVTAAADAQAREAIRKIHGRNPGARIVVTGCYAQRAPEDLAELPGVSWVIGNSHKPEIAQLLVPEGGGGFVPVSSIRLSHSPPEAAPAAALDYPYHNIQPAQPRAEILRDDIFAHSEFLSAPVLGGEAEHTRPTLKIQDGCDLRCTYCVIPFVRGKSRSLPPDAVITEIGRLVASGFREIVLSGINLGMYGRDLSPRASLLDLLRQVLQETSLERLRLSSIEPQDVTQDLVDLFASTDRLAEHFHMPLQSGSDRILAAMHRWYRTEHYARRAELIRERLPHAAIGADVIAGFPGESEADHGATLAFIQRLPITYLHVFSYSARPGTKAAALANPVPAHIIKRRARELRALSDRKAATFRRSQLGRTLRVLTLRHSGGSTDARTTPALSSNYLRVHLSGELPANTFHEVAAMQLEGAQLAGG